MALVQFNDVGVSYGTKHILRDAALAVYDDEIAGLVGVNGCGKTTVLRLIAGTLAPETGRVDRKRGLRLGFLEQEPELPDGVSIHDAALSAFSDVVDMETRMRAVEHEIAAAEGDRRKELLTELGRLQDHFEHGGGYAREARAATVLRGIGFPDEEFAKPVSVLSGGERTRLALARLLLREADLLLLDEPTNHLDLDGIEWLEDYLRNKHRGAVLIVSHDRLFLDRTVCKTIELEAAQLKTYPGGYTKFAAVKEAAVADQARLYEQQKEFIAKQEDFIRRYHYGMRATEARGRRKQLDRMERLEAPVAQKRISVRFRVKRESGEVPIRVEEAAKQFDGQRLFQGLNFEVGRGERVGIVGPNGSGKTTLLRMMLGQETPTGGRVVIGHNVQFGYLAQKDVEWSGERTVLDEVWEHNRTLDEVEVRKVLGRFLFSDDEAIAKRLSALSGGERTRVTLACMMIDRPNLLLLDEPTNHLDIPSRVALERALNDYEGTLVVVSHDRYFINQVVKKLIVLDNQGGPGRTILGTWADYERLRGEIAARPAPRPAAPPPPPRVKEKPRVSKNRLNKIESEIGALEKEKVSLESELARPELYSDPQKAREVPRRYERVCRELEELYREWTAAGE